MSQCAKDMYIHTYTHMYTGRQVCVVGKAAHQRDYWSHLAQRYSCLFLDWLVLFFLVTVFISCNGSGKVLCHNHKGVEM